jgi:hypothetical protein
MYIKNEVKRFRAKAYSAVYQQQQKIEINAHTVREKQQQNFGNLIPKKKN